MIILFITLYLIIGALTAWAYYVWMICYEGKWMADETFIWPLRIIYVLIWPVGWIVAIIIAIFSFILNPMARKITTYLPDTRFEEISVKLAKHCSDFKARKKK